MSAVRPTDSAPRSPPGNGQGEPPPLFVLRRGRGPGLLLVHGSAADHGTWTRQLAGLRDRFAMLACDRRGAGRSPLPEGARDWSVTDHAGDLARVIEEHGAPLLACGSSFGAVALLELARRRPELLRGLVLCEPPLAPADDVPAVPAGFGCRFDRVVAERGGAAAGELFLRAVIGDAAFEGLPPPWRARACGMWRQIRADVSALARYRVGYASLRAVTTPVLLLRGARSAPRFAPTLDALRAALPNSRLETVPGAGHMMHLDAAAAFHARLTTLAG